MCFSTPGVKWNKDTHTHGPCMHTCCTETDRPPLFTPARPVALSCRSSSKSQSSTVQSQHHYLPRRSLTMWVTIPEIVTKNGQLVHAQRFHLHIWMTCLAGLFNCEKRLGCILTEVTFHFTDSLLAEWQLCHKANSSETMVFFSFFSTWELKCSVRNGKQCFRLVHSFCLL